MQQYLDLLRDIRDNGVLSEDRTGTGTLSVFGRQLRFNLQEGFPVVTTKKIFLKGVIHEVLWVISGDTNIKYLVDNGVHIWDAWSDDRGNLGRVYGHQLRQWESPYGTLIDQLTQVIEQIKNDPYSRRHVISYWNVADLPSMALPPCHYTHQYYVRDGKLSCMMTQRSADVFLGVGFNISSYALLTHMIAQVCDLEVGELIMNLGDAHIYQNHLSQVDLQLTREPLPLPTLWLNPTIRDIDDFAFEDIKVVNYQSHQAIKAPIAV